MLLLRRVWQVRSVPPADVAPRRDGGPGPLCRRSSTPRRWWTAGVYLIDGRPRSSTCRRRRGPIVAIVRRDHVAYGCSAVADRTTQAGARLLDSEPDRVHVLAVGLGRASTRSGSSTCRSRLSRRRCSCRPLGHARHERPHRHAPFRWPGQACDHLCRLRVRILAIVGFPLATGFWTKDKDHRGGADKGGTSGWILASSPSPAPASPLST